MKRPLLTLLLLSPFSFGDWADVITLKKQYLGNEEIISEFTEGYELAQSGDMGAQNNLGVILEAGVVVNRDIPQAIKWYVLAAKQGAAKAQSKLGYIYATGKGVPVDYSEAFKWFSLSANQDDIFGIYNLGAMYVDGNGVSQNINKGFQMMRRIKGNRY